jgi:hypothetical protein
VSSVLQWLEDKRLPHTQEKQNKIYNVAHTARCDVYDI